MGKEELIGLYGAGKSESGQSGEMDNEVLIGKAKTGFPGRGFTVRLGRKPSAATEQDLTGRPGTERRLR